MVAAGFCAGCPETYVGPEPPETPDPSVALYVTTELEKAQIRIQRLRNDVTLDCQLLALLPGRMAASAVDPALFDAASTEQLGKGKRAAVRSKPGTECDLVRIELENGKVFMMTLRAGYVDMLTVTGEGLVGSYAWPEVAPGYDASLERCSIAEPAPVRWSEPVPVGRNQRVEAIDRDGACAKLHLKSGLVWEVCMGEADLPLAAGDVIDVALSAGKVGVIDRTTIFINRHSRPNDHDELHIWLGEGPVLPENQDVNRPRISVTRDERCVVHTAECGMVTLPARVDVGLAQRTVALRSGEHVRLAHDPGTLELAVGRLDLVAIRAAACGDAVPRPSFVAIDRRRPREVRVAAEN